MPKINRRRIRANRQNAKKSTGPRTPEGKAKSRLNALKHGILAESIVIPDCDQLETAEKFNALLNDLTEELNPIGIIEEILVEQVAISYWRLRRAIRTEAGEIADRVEFNSRWNPERPNDRVSLPNLHKTHMIIRYETTIERRLHRALSALYVLQVRRKTEAATLSRKSNAPRSQYQSSPSYSQSGLPCAGESQKIPNEPNSPLYNAQHSVIENDRSSSSVGS